MAKKRTTTTPIETIRRDSFVFYRSFFAAIDACPLENQRDIYRAIATYALNGEPTELEGFPKAIFEMAKPQLDKNTERYRNGLKGKDHGTKGGAPSGNRNALKYGEKEPPTFEEVAEYFTERELPGEPLLFYNHYTANGWKWKNAEIADWRQMAVVWSKYSQNNPKTTPKQPLNNP